MSAPIARIDGLTKRFAGLARPALDAISAVIEPGRMTGLVGPDGAGKTTLIRHLVGLMQGDAGTVTVAGHDARTPAPIHEIIGYMPQRFGLYEELSVIENLRLHADLRLVAGERRREKFARLLRFTDLESFQGRLAGKLSGGMKQKLGLACALIGDPRLLLLDEPSVGVDPVSRRELWKMVHGLLDEGMAVLWSTAYLDEAERCDTVILLSEGRKLHDGPPAELMERVRGRTWQLRGLGEGERRGVLMRLLEEPAVIDGVIQGSHVRLVLAADAEPPAIERGEWCAVEPTFEDAFVDLLGGGPGGHSALAAAMAEKPAPDRPVIEARGLTKRFGTFTAVCDNSFAIRRGEIFGLLGPNGAGKSTTFKMLCGLLEPSEGDAVVTGLDLEVAPSRARARIGYMAQTFSLYGSLSVAQNLRFFARLYGLSGRRQRQRIALMTEVFALEPHLGTSAGALTPGLKQRLALACAVMHEPDVLFLDEPTSGVDPLTRREFWMHINALVEKGVTVMVTTHFMDEAEYCDRIGLIYRGVTIAMGTPDELKEKAGAAAGNAEVATLEDAFIALIETSDVERDQAA
jgi:ABC-2 type transport system ATP-binding protein